MFDLNPVPKVITFDCYGTLVQWREVLLRELAESSTAEGRDPEEAVALLDTFSKVSHVLTNDKPHRLYKEILRVGFRNALRAWLVGFRRTGGKDRTVRSDDGTASGGPGSSAQASNTL